MDRLWIRRDDTSHQIKLENSIIELRNELQEMQSLTLDKPFKPLEEGGNPKGS